MAPTNQNPDAPPVSTENDEGKEPRQVEWREACRLVLASIAFLVGGGLLVLGLASLVEQISHWRWMNWASIAVGGVFCCGCLGTGSAFLAAAIRIWRKQYRPAVRWLLVAFSVPVILFYIFMRFALDEL